MTAAFRDAVVARLAGWRVEPDRVEAATRRDTARPYLLVEFPPAFMDTDRFASRDFTADVNFQVTVVADSRRSALAVHDDVAAVLTDWVPDVPGWNCWPVGMSTRPRILGPDRGLIRDTGNCWEAATQWWWHATRTTPTP